jgi:hypothetical protein
MDGSVPASSVNEFLEHHGVKGMKWGVRKSESSGGGGGSSGSSEDHKSAIAAQRKINSSGTKALSNKELQGLIQRKNLEKQYHDMLVQEKSSLDRGDETIKKILKYGKTYNDVQNFLKTPAGQKVKQGFKIAGMAAKVGAAYATGGTSAAAGAGATIAVRRMSNHYTNVG